MTVAAATPTKHRRRKRRGRRTRWPSVAAAGPKTHPDAYPVRPTAVTAPAAEAERTRADVARRPESGTAGEATPGTERGSRGDANAERTAGRGAAERRTTQGDQAASSDRNPAAASTHDGASAARGSAATFAGSASAERGTAPAAARAGSSRASGERGAPPVSADRGSVAASAPGREGERPDATRGHGWADGEGRATGARNDASARDLPDRRGADAGRAKTDGRAGREDEGASPHDSRSTPSAPRGTDGGRGRDEARTASARGEAPHRDPRADRRAADAARPDRDSAEAGTDTRAEAIPDGSARDATPCGEPAERDGSDGRRHRATGPLYAALDLGTNNCRLLVAEPWHHGFRVVDAFSRIVRLGEGLSASGRLSDAAQDRAIEALRVCRGKLDGRGIVRSRLVATEACRAAENGEAFLERVEDETGLRLEILTRETEARLAVAGCANLIDWSADGALLFDIGGGSSELVWLEFGPGRRHGGDPTRHIRAWTSLPVGVVTLSERHGGVSVGASVFEAMVADVDALLADLDGWRDLEARLGPGRYHMVGTSGTVTTLAGVHLGLKRYDRRRVDGTWLSDDEVGEMIGRLLDMDFDDRVANPCIGIDRADLVLAGCAILEAIRRRWRCGRLRVADRGLREGMLTELMMDDGLWYRSGRGRRPGHGERSGR